MKILKYFPTIIGVLIIVAISWKVDRDIMFEAIKNCNPTLLLLALLVCLLNILIGAFRWHVILCAMRSMVKLRWLLQYQFEAISINLLVPSGLGGEVSKAMSLEYNTKNMGASYASVATDKLVGLTAFVSFVLVGVLGGWYSGSRLDVFVPVLSALLIVIIISMCFYIALLSKWTIKILRKTPKVRKFFELVVSSIHSSKQNPSLFLKIFLLALLGLFSQITSTYLVGQSLGLAVDFWFYFTLVPLIGLMAAVPISNSGIGIREGLFVIAFSFVGMSNEEAFTLSLMWTLLAIIIPAMAGALSLIARSRK